MINIDVPYQTNEMCGYRTVGVSDSNALWSPNVFGSISQTKDFHPRACVRKQETKNDDNKKNHTDTLTHSLTLTSWYNHANGRWPRSLHEVQKQRAQQVSHRLQLLDGGDPHGHGTVLCLLLHPEAIQNSEI